MMRNVIVMIIIVLFHFPFYAQLTIENGTSNYTIDFDATLQNVNSGSFNGSGFTSNPNSGELDTDAWASTGWSDGAKDFGIANTTGDYARGVSSGGVSTGGIYSFDVGGNQALGIQPGGSDFTPGTITLKMVNNSSAIINVIDLSYLIYIFNDQSRSNSFNFSYSIDNNLSLIHI